jgi:organic radical activating enzyme
VSAEILKLPTAKVKRYKINEMFYSIQGEGLHAGSASIFVRFSACNLDCPWCDTEYETGDMLTGLEILTRMLDLLPREVLPKHVNVVFTGGEPSLQITADLILGLRGAGFAVLTMETNGTKWKPCMLLLDTITVSPKTVDGWWHERVLPRKVVFKVVFDPEWMPLDDILDLARMQPAKGHFVQPVEDQETKTTNRDEVALWVQHNPHWRLSLQTHKILGLR